MSKIKNLSGQRFGRLFVIRATEERIHRNIVWLCRCDCGAIKKINGGNLKNGSIRSCGCLKKEQVTERNRTSKTHGHSVGGKYSRTYRSWEAMLQRCTNTKSKDYIRYGGRGIKVCNRWLKFKGFLKDMGERPRGTSIEREDNNGNYEPGNCKWSSAIVQAHNRRNTKLTTLKVQVIKKLLKESKLMQKEIAEIFHVSKGTVHLIAKGATWAGAK